MQASEDMAYFVVCGKDIDFVFYSLDISTFLLVQHKYYC